MATYDVGTGTAGTLRLIVNLTSQSIPSNTTTVAWELHLICGNHTSFQLTAKAWSANILGAGYSGSFTFDFRSTTDVLIASGSTTVSANSDGTPASTSVSGSIAATGTSGIGGPTTTSGTFTPPTIPRATIPTVSPTSGNTGSTYTIDVSTAASSAFYHDFYYSLDGGSTYTSLFSNIPATTTTEPWTPASTLLPNSSSVTAIIRVDTRSSSGGTIIGTANVSLPLTIPSSVVPTISGVSFVDSQTSAPDMPTLMGAAGRFVQGWSKLKPTVTSAGASGSSITSATVTLNGQVTPSGTAFGLPVALSGAVPYSAVATDSRSRSSVPFASTVAVTAYAFPNLPTPTVTRTSDAAGNVPSPTGTYIAITPLASVSSLNFSGEKNLLEWQIRIKPTSGSYTTVQAWTNATVSGSTWTTRYVAAGPYASSTEYVVEVSIRDLFGKNGYNSGSTVVTRTITVPTESIFMDEDHGEGLGLLKYRQRGALDVHGDTYTDGAFYQGAGLNPVVDTSLVATTGARGIAETATNAEALTMTDTSRFLTPDDLKYVRDQGGFDTRYYTETEVDTFLTGVKKGQIPSSVVVGSGSASVAADGTITFTGASSISLNAVFDGVGADIYEVWLIGTTSAGATVTTRMRNAGTDTAGTGYVFTAISTQLAAGPARSTNTATSSFGWWLSSTAGSGSNVRGKMIVMDPKSTNPTWVLMDSFSAANGDRWLWHEMGNDAGGARDGMSVICSAGTITGKMKVVKIS